MLCAVKYRHCTANYVSFELFEIFTMFTRACKMNFLRRQDDFFRTANQPISVRHSSQSYNVYIIVSTHMFANFALVITTELVQGS